MAKKGNKIKDFPYQKELLKDIPESPGVYLFKSDGENIIYVGKANNLKRRLKSYFLVNLTKKTNNLLKETKHFSIIRVNSELEALLLEARLIKDNQPKYNSAQRDDKKPLYIRITDETYPRVLTARRNDKISPNGIKNQLFLGPFPSSSTVKNVLSLLRKIFPFSQHKVGNRVCIYRQMGLCKPCPNEINKLKNEQTKKELRNKYLYNIRMIKAVLSGRFFFVRKSLEKVMRQYAKEENFEMAQVVRNQIKRLDYITQPATPIKDYLKNPNLLEDLRNEELNQLRSIISKYLKIPKTLTRIECYDVAHLSGTKPAASMVTFINGEPDKSLYRHFRIRQKKGKSDTDSLYELAIRRAKYLSTWGHPDLIVVDGGRGQVSILRKVFKKYKVPVVGLAKREEKLVIPVKRNGLKTHSFVEKIVPTGPARNLVVRIRNEAHRFARRYHHKLLQKALRPEK